MIASLYRKDRLGDMLASRHLPSHFLASNNIVGSPISLEKYTVWFIGNNLILLLFFRLISLLAPRSKG